ADEKNDVRIFVAVPELIHSEIEEILKENGFFNLEFLDSKKEAEIMERYFEAEGRYSLLHNLPFKKDVSMPKITVYAASFYKDKKLDAPPHFPKYVKKILLGCDGAKNAGVNTEGLADFYDNTGDNISDKNTVRCEMTAHYWIWKNRLNTDDEYVGVCHYRRTLDVTDEDLLRMKGNDVDVVLPYPMLHYPNCSIQHSWYASEKDWEIMLKVVGELYPEYAKKADEVFKAQEFYNYNMLIAKKEVFANYCNWVFPILDKIEEESEPLGKQRNDRYTAYLSESLLTLYFEANKDKYKICHTGRLLFT
nr:DUF4422 domain-containing protein [Eubacterium sp.]